MDEREFTEWAAGCQRQLLRSAYLICGDLQRAEDLVQEALVKVALRWAKLRTGSPTAYARTIIVRDNISSWRRRKGELTVADPTDLAAVSSDPDTAMVVRRALDRLTLRQRVVLVLRHFDTGEFERLTSGDGAAQMHALAVAADVLASDWDG